MQYSRCVLLFLVGIVGSAKVLSQDLETLKDQKLLKVNGGVNVSTTYYDAQGIDNRRDPFYWMLNANLNFNILNIVQAPFSMTLSQQDKKFSQPQPFNRFGLSPRYKMVTAHLGHRSMNFSEYTLAGNMFLGAGVEVAPRESFVRVSAMYGRLAKAVARTAQEGMVFAKPTFKRMGYGVKVGLGREKNQVDLIVFKGWDDPNSIPVTDSLEVLPESNLVLGLVSKNQIGERVSFELEYAYSLFNRDSRAVQPEASSFSFVNNLGGLFKPNLSSDFSSALTSTLTYSADRYQANVKFRNVDPGYRTLGSAFLNNGMKDLTGGLSWSMFKQKVNVSTSAGLQQTKSETSVVRVIYNIDINYNASDRLSLASSYSNFSTSTRQSQLQRTQLIDTLEYFQVTKNYAANVNYKLGALENPITLLLSGSVQDATDNNGTASTFYNFTLGEQMKVASAWMVTISGAYNKNITIEHETGSVGPIVNISRAFLEGKVRSAFSAAILNSFEGESNVSQVQNFSFTNNLRVGKKHGVAFNVYYLKNNERSIEGTDFSEIRAMLNYNYSF